MQNGVRPSGIILVIIVILSLAIGVTIIDHRRIAKLHEEFSEIKSNDTIRGTISDIHAEKGACFLTLKSGNKILIHGSENCLYDNECLDQNLQIGDTLRKNESSDTLYIRNRDKNLYFVIGKVINRK